MAKTYFGVDISEHNGTVDWAKVAKKVDFAILRIGWVGNTQNKMDVNFIKNYNAAKKAGVKLGAYVYMYSKTAYAAKAGAEWILKQIKGLSFDLPLYCDMEDPTISKLSKAELTNITIAFNEAIKKGGYVPGVYANLNWFTNKLDKVLRTKYHTWIAHYTSGTDKYKGSYGMWQNSSKGKVDGVKGKVDTNYLYESIAASTPVTVKPAETKASTAAKTNKGLVEYAIAQIGKPYWYGTFGQVSDAALYATKKKEYPVQYKWDCKNNQPGVVPAKQLGEKVHDCVGLIKGYLWCTGPTDKKPKYNAAQDKSANGMYAACKTKGAIATMPDIPGVLVFMDHHVGVYIGNGYVVEAKGHAYGVVKTALKGRGWTSWGYCPYIEYEKAAATQTKPAATTKPAAAPTYKVGNTYTLQVDLFVRTGAGTDCAKKKRSELTDDGKKNAKLGVYAVLKKGTRVTVKTVQKKGSDIWVHIPSGWIAAYYSGKVYVK